MFTYFNPILQFGLERFAATLADAGACGAIVPDVPLEEIGRDCARSFAPHGLALPLLVAPTTPCGARRDDRAGERRVHLPRLAARASRARDAEPDFAWIAARAAALRAVSDTPIAIGFGISTAAHVRRAWEIADGAIVGSALIDAYAGTSGDEAVARGRAILTCARSAALADAFAHMCERI